MLKHLDLGNASEKAHLPYQPTKIDNNLIFVKKKVPLQNGTMYRAEVKKR